MDREELLRLLSSSNRTLADLQHHEPALFRTVGDLAASELAARVGGAVADAPADLVARVGRVVEGRRERVAEALREVREDVRRAEREGISDGIERVEGLASLPVGDDPLARTDLPLRELPLLQPVLDQARLHLAGDLAGIPAQKMEAVVTRLERPAALDDEALESLISARVLDAGEARELAFSAALLALVDDDPAAARAARAVSVGADGQTPKSTRDLAALDGDAWARLLQDARVTPPEGTSLDEHAGAIAARVATLYPTAALVGRLPKPTETLVRDEHERRRLANAFAGLELGEILEDSSVPAAERARRASARIELVTKVLSDRPEEELLALDYLPGSADLGRLGLDDAAADDRRRVVATFKSFQRAYAVAGDADQARVLLEAGFASARRIATTSLAAFQSATKLGAPAAADLHGEARRVFGSVNLMATSLLDYWKGRFGWLAETETDPEVDDFLAKLDGFETLFGSQSYCACEHCQSILGPAAYFVDLMWFVQEHIREPLFAARPDHVLDLKQRRPDLWTLSLTCANTTTMIPTLELVAEILETYIAQRAGFTGDLAERTSVERFVYRQTLPTAVDSFGQPFFLPLERIAAYLMHFETSRGALARALGAPARTRVLASLRLSAVEEDLLVTPDRSQGFLERIYGMSVSVAGEAVGPVDTRTLRARMGVSRDELGQLLATRFVNEGLSTPITVKAEKASSASVQNDVENVRGLTLSALDRLHRFTRLWRRLPWRPSELDLVFAWLHATEIDAAALDAVVSVRTAQERLGMSVEETCAMFGDVPDVPASADASSLVDRAFNPAAFAADGPLPDASRRFLHPALRVPDSGTASGPALARLLYALGVDEDALGALVRGLAGALGADLSRTDPDPQVMEDARRFELSARNLALLFRHAALARRLGMAAAELFQLLAMTPGILAARIETLADLETFLDFHGWWKSGRLSLDELALATGGPTSRPEAFPTPAALAAEVIDGAQEGMIFADTVFAVALGISGDDSRRLIAANDPRIVRLRDGRLRLADDFDPATALHIPAGVAVSEPEARQVLARYHSSEIVPRRLAAALRMATGALRGLLGMVGATLVGAPWARILRGDEPPTVLEDLTRTLQRLSIAFRAPAFDQDALAWLQANPGVFGLGALDALGPEDVRALSIYARVVGEPEPRFEGQETVSPTDVQVALAAFQSGSGFPASVDDALARALRTSADVIATLRPGLPSTPLAAFALERLATAVELVSRFGIGGDALTALLAEDYATLAGAADALLAAFRARYPDDEERRDKLEPSETRILSRKRDALADHLVYSVHPEFDSRRELYQYFLLDVEYEGCARTSRVAAAISSVQLYVHRVLMNLERDRRPPNDPDHLQVTLAAEGVEEWAWRKNYRVWEANRKVFLWPENYLLPELRDDRTPLFEDLESELLQQEVSDQTVLDAYTRYLAGFDEVANLTIAGVHHVVRGATDVLHLFGCTSTDPPVFYYRTCQDLQRSGVDPRRSPTWSPWRRMNVQIPVKRVTPFVHDERLYLFWVEIRTQPVNRVADGASKFAGYRHRFEIKLTHLRQDGSWSAPQQVELTSDFPFALGPGLFEDPLSGSPPRPRHADVPHTTPPEPIDTYALTGPNYEVLYADSGGLGPRLTGRNFWMLARPDLFERTSQVGTSWAIFGGGSYAWTRPVPCRKGNELFTGTPERAWLPPNAHAALVLEDSRIRRFYAEYKFTDDVWQLEKGLYQHKLANLPAGARLIGVAGSVGDALLQAGPDVLLLRSSIRPGPNYVIERVGTTLARTLARLVFSSGVDELLDLRTQQVLKEAGLPVTLVGSRVQDRSNKGTLDFRGPYGAYYREIFLHVPFLLANHLNGQQRFAAAQRWYHYLFDPTAVETIPPGATPTQVARIRRDRVWRMLELRGLDIPKLRDVLTDPAALEKYRTDPFNPHAIARLRLTAYQKAIFMRYVDNLLDWGDQLFTQFTRESVNEALMIYTMAADLLGPRPAQLGACGEEAVVPRTYERIAPHLSDGGDVLVEIESFYLSRRIKDVLAVVSQPRFDVEVMRVADAGRRVAVARHALAAPLAEVETMAPAVASVPAATVPAVEATATVGAVEAAPAATGLFAGMSWKRTATSGWIADRGAGVPRSRAADLARGEDYKVWGRTIDRFGWSVVRQVSPAFCVPPNKDLLAYWDRVEDRLFKIHNCMDITGVMRQPALFAPEIDPRLLIKMQAAGLSLEDVLDAGSGELPPYRFVYLIERAKTYAATLQGLGAALLAAIEKRDGEELNRLRLAQQQHLAKMTTQVRRWEVSSSEDTIESLKRQRAMAVLRRDYHDHLLQTDRVGAEYVQQTAWRAAAVIHGIGAALGLLGGVMRLLPQVGSPFAMKYGGVELGSSARNFAAAQGILASASEIAATTAGVEASFTRRREGWEHARKLAEADVRQLDKQVAAAEVRRDIAARALEIHEKSLEQIDEMHEFLQGRFAGAALYGWMATTLMRLHREAYRGALSFARLAERAWRYERDEDPGVSFAAGSWDADRAGLLSGERLLLDLQALEQRYLETHHRTLELDQAISLGQIDPAALVELRETGTCEFAVPELAFDLVYPGHYRRRLKMVRLTIPCITGPYTNVSASLTLLGSAVRKDPGLAAADLAEVPLPRSLSVATSSAQNDAGVFELSYRDERYMPFEGAGAVSRWRLELPQSFRPFDYQTISDVVLSMSYTALEDGKLKQDVEALTATLEGAILSRLTSEPLARVFSLRHDFSTTFQRLLHSAAGTVVPLEISERLFPAFARQRGRTVQIQSARLALRLAEDASLAGFDLSVDETGLGAFAPDASLGGLPSSGLPAGLAAALLGTHGLSVSSPGDLAPTAPAPGDTAALDERKLLDILLHVEFKVAVS